MFQTENTQPDTYDQKVFKSLVNVIHMVTEDPRYQQFIPVLELYINENFYAALVYSKLLTALNRAAEDSTLSPVELTQAMKCLKYIFKFVVRSRTLFSQLNNGKGQEAFEQHLKVSDSELVISILASNVRTVQLNSMWTNKNGIKMLL